MSRLVMSPYPLIMLTKQTLCQFEFLHNLNPLEKSRMQHVKSVHHPPCIHTYLPLLQVFSQGDGKNGPQKLEIPKLIYSICNSSMQRLETREEISRGLTKRTFISPSYPSYFFFSWQSKQTSSRSVEAGVHFPFSLSSPPLSNDHATFQALRSSLLKMRFNAVRTAVMPIILMQIS